MFEREGIEFTIRPADVDETPLPDETPAALVERLAVVKATAVAAEPNDVVVAADTIVTVNGSILGKPEDMDHAREMIKSLQGKRHQVMTGVCIHRAVPKRTEHWVCNTTVEFNALDDEQIEWYLKNATPLDKAGAYGIQEHREFLVKALEGSYDNVVGLPIDEVVQMLASFASDGQT